jgi:hypothetical protein
LTEKKQRNDFDAETQCRQNWPPSVNRLTPYIRRSRTPDILADAAYLIFTKPAKSFTGQFLIDDTFLAGEGVTDFDA